MNVVRASAAVTVLALGLAAAETSGQTDRWVRTAVTNEYDGSPASTAFGPVQMTKTLADDIRKRGMIVQESLIDALIALYKRVYGLKAGEAYHPSEEQRLAYWTAVSAYWEHLQARAGGDIELAVCYWRWGEYAANDHGGTEGLKAYMRKEDPHYLQRFVGAL